MNIIFNMSVCVGFFKYICSSLLVPVLQNWFCSFFILTMIITKKINLELDISNDYSQSCPSHWYYYNSSCMQIDILNSIYISQIVMITGILWTSRFSRYRLILKRYNTDGLEISLNSLIVTHFKFFLLITILDCLYWLLLGAIRS